MSVASLRRSPIAVMATAACLVAWSADALAHESTGSSLISFGIGGVHRTGEWTPVSVRVEHGGGDHVRIAVEDPDGQFVASPPVAIGGDGTFTTHVRPGRPLPRIKIVPEGQGRKAAAALLEPASIATVPSTTPLLLVVGHIPAAESAARLVAGEEAAMQVIQVGAPADLVARTVQDLDAFDAALVCGSAVPRLPPSTLNALDGWVRRGGRLILSAGASAQAIAAEEGPARGWLPGDDSRLVPLRRAGAIEAFARASGLSARIPAAGVMVPRFERVTGLIAAFEGASAADLPLLVRRGHGFGTITWLGIDLDDPWCANWNGCDRLVAGLLGGRREVDTVAPPPGDTVAHVPDLAGQLRVAMDAFPARDGRPATLPVPFELIAAIGIAYCLVLYPFDWWIVRRSGRPWLSWFTLPLAASGFAAAGWGVGVGWGRDAPARARVAGMIDFDAASGLVRGSGWAAVRSPHNGKLSVRVHAASDDRVQNADTAVSWFADRGPGFGGVDATIAHPSLAASDYAYGRSLAELEAVPIAAASTRLFEARWTGKAGTPLAESFLTTDARGLLTGRVTSNLPVAIERCWLLHGGWLYDVGRMEPGDTYDTDAGRGPRSLSAALTRRAAIRDRDRAERWDASSADIARILEIAGLHDAAGGTTYTGLVAGRLGRLDLSPLVATNRALLVGSVADAGFTTWTMDLDREGNHESLTVEQAADTIVRLVVPVGVAEEAPP